MDSRIDRPGSCLMLGTRSQGLWEVHELYCTTGTMKMQTRIVCMSGRGNFPVVVDYYLMCISR